MWQAASGVWVVVRMMSAGQWAAGGEGRDVAGRESVPSIQRWHSLIPLLIPLLCCAGMCCPTFLCPAPGQARPGLPATCQGPPSGDTNIQHTDVVTTTLGSSGPAASPWQSLSPLTKLWRCDVWRETCDVCCGCLCAVSCLASSLQVASPGPDTWTDPTLGLPHTEERSCADTQQASAWPDTPCDTCEPVNITHHHNLRRLSGNQQTSTACSSNPPLSLFDCLWSKSSCCKWITLLWAWLWKLFGHFLSHLWHHWFPC